MKSFFLPASDLFGFFGERRWFSVWYGMTEYPFERSIPDSDAGFKIGDAGGSNIVDVAGGVNVTTLFAAAVAAAAD